MTEDQRKREKEGKNRRRGTGEKQVKKIYMTPMHGMVPMERTPFFLQEEDIGEP